MSDQVVRWSGLCEKIKACIEEAKDEHLSETAMLLNIAHLDLLTRVHGITDAELDALLNAVRCGSLCDPGNDQPPILN